MIQTPLSCSRGWWQLRQRAAGTLILPSVSKTDSSTTAENTARLIFTTLAIALKQGSLASAVVVVNMKLKCKRVVSKFQTS